MVVAGEHGAGRGPRPLGQPHPRSSPAAPGHGYPRGGEGKRRLWCQQGGGRQVPSRAVGLGTGCGPRWDCQGGCPGAGAEVGKVSVPAGHPERSSAAAGAGGGHSTRDRRGAGAEPGHFPIASDIPPAWGRPQRSLPGPTARGDVPRLTWPKAGAQGAGRWAPGAAAPTSSLWHRRCPRSCRR